jgi:hypothetical protein
LWAEPGYPDVVSNGWSGYPDPSGLPRRIGCPERKVRIVRVSSFAAVAALFFAFTGACGGSRPETSTSGSASSSGGGTADAGDAGGDAGSNEPPFAGSAAEATTLISAAVDKKGSEIGACVREFRLRKKLARERVTVSFGIDMEGKLLGVTSKGKEDAELKACVHKALDGAQFPRSHAGVITVTKTYEELLQ